MQGIPFFSLKDGSTVQVETCNSTYQIRRENREFTWMLGGTRKDGSTRYPIWSPIMFIGSTWGGSDLRIGYIGKAMLMDFYDIQRDRTITTSPIRTIALMYSTGPFFI